MIVALRSEQQGWIVCSNDLGFFFCFCFFEKMALAAFEKQILGRQELEGRAKLICHFQDNQRFTVVSLGCEFSSFSFRYSCSK